VAGDVHDLERLLQVIWFSVATTLAQREIHSVPGSQERCHRGPLENFITSLIVDEQICAQAGDGSKRA